MKKIKMMVMDVDGTLTDGKIYMGENGEIMKAFDVHDGYAIANILPAIGIMPVIITGRNSRIVENRAKELHIVELHQGVSDKAGLLKTIADKYRITLEEVAYIGDDLNDMECIACCGMTACPSDAADEVKQAVGYVCDHPGGRGAVREYIEMIKEANFF